MIVISGDNGSLSIGANRFYFTVIGDYLPSYTTVSTTGRYITSLGSVMCNLPFVTGSIILNDINPVEASQSSTYTRRITGKELHYIDILYDGLSTGTLDVSLDVTYIIDTVSGVDTFIEQSLFTLYLPTKYELETESFPSVADYYPNNLYVSTGNKGGEFKATDDIMSSIQVEQKFSIIDYYAKGFSLPAGSNPMSILFQLSNKEYTGDDLVGITPTALAVSRSQLNTLDSMKEYANISDNPSKVPIPSSLSYSSSIPQVGGFFGNMTSGDGFSWGVRTIPQTIFHQDSLYYELVTPDIGTIELKYGGLISIDKDEEIEYCGNRTLYFWNTGDTTDEWRDTHGIPFSLELIKVNRGYLTDLYDQDIIRTWIVPKPNTDLFKTIDYDNFDKYMANSEYMKSYGINGELLNIDSVQEIYISNLKDENENELPFYIITVIRAESNIASEVFRWGISEWGTDPWIS